MGKSKLLLVAFVAIATSILALPAIVAAAPTTPTTPFDAFTMDGGQGSYLYGAGGFTLDDSNATISEQSYGAGINMTASSTQFLTPWTALVTPPLGSAFTVGTTYATLRAADATHAGLDVFGDGRGCNQASGSVTIKELTTDAGSGAVTAFAATYSESCELTESPVTGELRWHSSVDYVAATTAPASLAFGALTEGQAAPVMTTTVTSTGSAPLILGTASITGQYASRYQVSSDSCDGQSLAYGATCSLSVTPLTTPAGTDPTTSLTAELTIPDNTAGGARIVPLTSSILGDPSGHYYPIVPARILDTRNGTGTTAGPLGAGATIDLAVANRGFLPTTGIAAVVLNVTVTNPSTNAFLTVYPSGTQRPLASNLNFSAGETVANSVTVQIGTDGGVDLYNDIGHTDVIADVVGYYAAATLPTVMFGNGSTFEPLVPSRVFDSRLAGSGGPFLAGEAAVLPIDFGVDDPNVSAVAINITATSPQSVGYLTTWNGQGSLPTASTVNFVRGATVANFAIVPAAPCLIVASCAGYPSIGIFNGSAGTVNVIVDVFGYYDDVADSDGLVFHPLPPTRIADTRIGQGAPHAISGGMTATVTTPAAVGDENTFALQLNVTAIDHTGATYLTVWPQGDSGVTQPFVSNVNLNTGQTVPNAVVTAIGPTGAFNVYNNIGSSDVVIDVDGYFDVQATSSGSTPGSNQSHPNAVPEGHAVIPALRPIGH